MTPLSRPRAPLDRDACWRFVNEPGEDSSLFADEITRVLETDPTIQVVARAENGQAAVDLARRLRPDARRHGKPFRPGDP